jgi:phosphate transport system substrate-binding protein
LVSASFAQTAKLKAADPGVDISARNVTTCHNPTFVAGQPSRNYLAEIAPQPPACDKTGAGPCTGTANDAVTKNPTGTGKLPTTPGATPSAGPSAAPSGAVDPVTGQVDGTGATDQASADLIGVPTELAADRTDSSNSVLSVLAVIEILLVLVIPPLLARTVFRRKDAS